MTANSVVIAEDWSYLLRLGARPDALDAASGLLLVHSDPADQVQERWFVPRTPVYYLITLYRAPQWPSDSPYLQSQLARTLRSWRWTG